MPGESHRNRSSLSIEQALTSLCSARSMRQIFTSRVRDSPHRAHRSHRPATWQGHNGATTQGRLKLQPMFERCFHLADDGSAKSPTMPRSTNQTSPGCGTVSCSELVSERVAASGRAQNVIFRAVCLDRERNGSAFDDLFIEKFKCGPWFQADFFQDRFSLALQFGVIATFGAHVPLVVQTWPIVKKSFMKLERTVPFGGQ